MTADPPRPTPTTKAGRDLAEWGKEVAIRGNRRSVAIEVRNGIAQTGLLNDAMLAAWASKIEAEARDATGRDALDLIRDFSRHRIGHEHTGDDVCAPCVAEAALAATPQEPCWPSADDEQAVRELTNAMEDNYTMGGLDDPTHVEARRILAALREGAERPTTTKEAPDDR